MDGNAHNIAAWNAYKASASNPPKTPTQISHPHIPEWAKWFDPEPIRAPPKVLRFLSVYCEL